MEEVLADKKITNNGNIYWKVLTYITNYHIMALSPQDSKEERRNVNGNK